MPRQKAKILPELLPAEKQARKLRAQLEVLQLKEAHVRMKAALSTYAAADTGRRNRDWRPNGGSADLAIIPDSTTLNPRARQLDRDSWVARSIKKSFTRNVVGKSITITPHAKDKKGKPLTVLNAKAQDEFHRWSRSAAACDVEKRKTFPQFQRLAAKEQIIVGEHLWLWSYRMPANDGDPVGLKLQAFEPEQFDLRILSFEAREVRGGVEVDENGAPLAYHLYTRNPNDVLYRHAFFSERVPANRMFHYFEQDRVLQTRGVSRLAPIMSDIRDLDRFRSATLWRCIMESCIGIIVKSIVPGGNFGPSPLLPLASGESPATSSGLRTDDFVPGMVPRLVPGEDVTPFIPQSPGNQYDPFTTLTIRGIGAGVGMSFGQIMRQSDGNYSSARQDMLEDRKEIEPEQDLIIDSLIRPTYELWYSFAAIEGKFDGVEGFDLNEFLAERHRFTAADYIPPPQTWIDPEKEANAFAILLKNRLITREEIVAMRGGRFYQLIEKLAAERDETDALNLTLPEDDPNRTEMREFVKAYIENRLGTLDNLASNTIDISKMVDMARLPVRKFKQTELPVNIQEVKQDTVPAKADAPAGGNGHANGNGKPKDATAAARIRALDANANDFQFEQQARSSREIDSMPTPGELAVVPPNVPDYKAATLPAMACSTCSFLMGERCTRFNFTVEPEKVCDDWSAKTLTENIGVPNTAKAFPPTAQPGQRPLEDRFFPQADPASQP